MITQQPRRAPAGGRDAPRGGAAPVSRWALAAGLAVVAWSVTEAGDLVLSIPEACCSGSRRG